MEFGFDPAKRQKNILKHGLDFPAVFPCFSDAAKVVWQESRHEYGEVRCNMLAVARGRVHHVTFTARETVVWIISARKANRREQRRYDRNH